MVVLITGSESTKAILITRSLGSKGVEVHNAGTNYDSPVFSSKYSKSNFVYTDPSLSESDFLLDLLNILKSKKYELLIPTHSKDTYIISKNFEQISNYVSLPLVDYEKILLANNKKKVTRLASKIGIPVPETIYPTNLRDLEKVEIKYPVVIKILDGSGNKGLEYAKDKAELIKKYRNLVEKYNLDNTQYPIIQEKIVGYGAGTSFLFFNGNSKFFFSHKRLREYPITGGPSTLRIGYRNKLMEKSALRILKEMKWNGVAMCEFLIEKNSNIPYLIEINPRFWGSIYQPIVSGVDFPYLLYSLFTGKKIKPIKRIIGLKTRYILLDYLNFPAYFSLSNNKIHDSINFFRNRDYLCDIEDSNDFRPTFNFYIDKLKTFFKANTYE